MPLDWDPALAGRRVKLISCDDPYTTIRPGDCGTVQGVNNYDIGDGPKSALSVKWDDGSTLSLISGVDEWVLLPGGGDLSSFGGDE